MVADLNGDRILDVALSGDPPRVQVAELNTLSPRPSQVTLCPLTDGGVSTCPRAALRSGDDLTVNLGLGLSPAEVLRTSRGEARAVTGHYPSVGVGIGVNLSRTTQDLIDVNGDGLLDHVRFERTDPPSQDSELVVRLNLGRRFAAQEDRVRLPDWAPDPASFKWGPYRFSHSHAWRGRGPERAGPYRYSHSHAWRGRGPERENRYGHSCTGATRASRPARATRTRA